MADLITGKVIEIAQIDTRSSQAKYFKNFQDADGNMDDAAFKKAVTQAKGKYNKPVLVIESLSSHYGYINGNQAFYQPKHGPTSAKTFTKPFQKPVLRSHNMFSDADPIGRVTDARYVDYEIPKNKQNDLTTRKGVIRTFSTITDADAIEKIMDTRYLTQSVSGITPTVDCSICGVNLRDTHCEHEFGKEYEGKICYKIFGPISYDEVSYVWKPADKEAKTLRFQTVGPMDCMDTLLKDAIQAEMIEDGAYEELSYYLVDSCGSRKKMYSFADNKEVASDNMSSDSVTETASEPKPTTSTKDNSQVQTTQEDRRSPMDLKLSECKIQDVLAIGFVKEHIEGLVKDAAAKATAAEAQVATLTTKVQDLEKSDAAYKKEIEDLGKKLQVFDTQRLSSKVNQLIDTMVKLQKPAVKAMLDEKDEKKRGELRDALVADYGKKPEVVIDELVASYVAEIPKEEPKGAVTQMVDAQQPTRDSRVQTGASKGPSLGKLIDKKPK